MHRTILKWLTWTVAVPSLIIALALAVLLVTAHTDRGRAWLAQRMEQEVEKALGLDLQIESLEGNLLYEIKAKQVSLVQDGKEVFTCPNLVVSYNLLAIWGGRVELINLRLESPRLNLAALPPGLTSGQPEGGSADQALRVRVHRLEILDAGFEPQGGLEPLTSLSGVNLKGGFRLDEDGPQADLKFELGRLSFKSSRMRGDLALAGRLELNRREARLSDLVIKQGPNKVRGSARYSWAAGSRLSLDLHAPSFSLTDLPTHLPDWVRPKAPFDIRVILDGPLNHLAAKLQVSQRDTGINLQGDFDLTNRTCRLTGRARGLDIEDWGMSPFRVAVTGDLVFSGLWKPESDIPDMRLQVDAQEVSLLGEKAKWVRTTAQMKGDRILIDHLEAEGDWGGLRAGGVITLGPQVTGLDIDTEVENLEPPTNLSGPLHKTRFSGKVKLSGHDRDLGLDINLHSVNLSGGLNLETFTASGRVQDEGMELSRLELSGPLGELSAQGRLDLKGAALDFAGRANDLAKLEKGLVELGLVESLELAGRGQWKGRLEGNWPRPNLRLTAEFNDATVTGLTAGSLKLEMQADRLGPSPLGTARISGKDLDISGQTSANTVLNITAGSNKITLVAQGQLPDGNAGLTLEMPSPLAWPLKLTISQFSRGLGDSGIWRQEGRAQATLEPGGLDINGLRLKNRAQEFALTGGMAPDGRIQGILTLRSLSLAKLLPQAMLPTPTLLDGSVKLGGTVDQPSMEVSADLSRLEFTGLPPAQVSLHGAYSDGWLRLNGGVRINERPMLDVDLWVGVELGLFPLDYRFTKGGLNLGLHSSELPLALLEPLVSGVSDLKGLATVDLNLSGPFHDLYLDGEARLDGGSMVISANGQKLDHLTIRMSARGSEIEVTEISARSGGNINLSGRLRLPRGRSWGSDLRLTADNFRVSLGPWGVVSCNADLSLAGSLHALKLRGEITPRRARLNTQVNPLGGMEDVVILEPGQSPPSLNAEAPSIKPPGFLNRADIDATLNLGERLRVELNQGWLEAGGRVTARKKRNQPLSYHGVIRMLDGRVLFEGRAFKVKGGSLDFAGRQTLDPLLKDITAQLTMGRNQVMVSLSGTALDPKVQMTSEPPMSQADILSTIIFGQPASGLNQRQYEILSAQALAILGLKGRSELERLVGRRLAPDVVTVQQNYGSSEYLEAGKYLSDNLYLRYRRDTDQKGGQGIGVEFRLNPYLSLESQYGDSRETGVDITINFDF